MAEILRNPRFVRARAIVAVVAVVAAGCSSERQPPSEPCPRAVAAFRLEVTAAEEAIPDDVSIVVRYQGSQEERFDVKAPAEGNEDVCCRASGVEAGPLPGVSCPGQGASDGGLVGAVYCELWTSGIAEVTVRGGDYPDIVETLQAATREDECGLETVSVRLVLTHRDGGR